MTDPQVVATDSTSLAIPCAAPLASRVPYRRHLFDYGLPLVLFAISICTTTAIGARFMQNFLDGAPAIVNDTDLWPWPWLLEQPSRFLLGWPFSAALLTILLTHEFGHYFACRFHGIRATLPWVLPAPTLSGTAGAVIRLRSPIPNRRALMDVGVYGPLAGFVASLATVTLGFLLSSPAAAEHPASLIRFGQPAAIGIVHALLNQFSPGIPNFEHAARHPVLIAGWVGLFITSLNLIPGGQLDGGHILYALAPRWHRWTTRLLPFALVACGIFFWVGWMIWGILLLIPALRHPRVPIAQPLALRHKVLAAVALAILVFTLSLEPLVGSSLLDYLR